MPLHPLEWKVVVDCADPHRQAGFWAAALCYVVEDNSAFIERLLARRAVSEGRLVVVRGRHAWRELAAIRHPADPVDADTGTGLGRRLLFQAVPEPKTAKNRLHLDLHVGRHRLAEEVDRLTHIGATVLRTVDDRGSHHVTMADPEGNEFDVQ
ncbi:hypothetical protein Sru01_21620 [Sphaerisporangium rufum]|uniref:Glyoxalase-like domain-containing protein n=1 Tax=Sphaerisporangium rufum TaxID=1381558 RepID=A0A919R4T9_9ACTN|nr:VOC family protein [Sphaerisporangium rufum]GII77180.1 hypothetical protein Sru01_21620 [Sphaerisporangium rufum]